MKLKIQDVEILLDSARLEISLKLQDQFSDICVLANLLGYTMSFGNNSLSKNVHCYFKFGNEHKYTLTFYYDDYMQLTKYCIYVCKGKRKIYRKIENEAFMIILDNFKYHL